MTQITDIFSLEALDASLRDGYVRRQFHPADPDLAILNYSEKAQFEMWWDDVTSACRGLIYRVSTGEVLARPFPKFHNWDQSGQPYPPHGPVVVMDKMDGSLGILYRRQINDETEWSVATRGSFASDQAKRATDLLRHSYESYSFEPMITRTYLFEIIYPENRIVVDYAGDERLVLLDVLDTATGLPDMPEFDECGWPHKVRRRLEPKGFYPQLLDDETLEGDEGLVLLWPATGYRVKMKRADYVHLHRLVFGLDERKVWEAMRSHIDIDKFCEPLPDEFHQWVRDVVARISNEQNARLKEIFSTWAEVRSGLREDYTRKDFAISALRHADKGYLFAVEDGRDIKDEVLDDLKPAGNQYATRQTEDTA